MYQIGGWLEWFVGGRRAGTAKPALAIVSTNVVFLGLTSLFTDISSEMIVSVLPIYLVGFLRMSPAQFGIIDGLYQGVAGIVQLLSALAADRLRRYKEIAALGYGASLVSRAGLLATSGAGGLAAVLTLDRLGKGMRTAPRDALISLSVPPASLGTAFGVHRAMDALGAMLGPIVAFLVLQAIADGFDVVFVFSLCSAVVGLAVLTLFVENREPTGQRLGTDDSLARNKPGSLAVAVALLKDAGFRHLALSALLLGSMTISDGFVYLTLQRRANLSAGAFPLLYVMTSAFFLLFAIPMGRTADAVGRFRVFLAGHTLLVALYAALALFAPGFVLVIVALPLLGLYYAATEGVLMAVGSGMLPEPVRTSGLAVLTTAVAVARFGGSVLFGIVWSRFGLQPAVGMFLAGLCAAIAAVIAMRPSGVVWSSR
jgi:MFS family permease